MQTANLDRLHGRLAKRCRSYRQFYSKVNGITVLHSWAAYATASHLKETTEDELVGFLHEKSNHRLGKLGSRRKAGRILGEVTGDPVYDSGQLSQAHGHVISDLALRLLPVKRSLEAVEESSEKTITATGQQNSVYVLSSGVEPQLRSQPRELDLTPSGR